jgi:hypothetical protein
MMLGILAFTCVSLTACQSLRNGAGEYLADRAAFTPKAEVVVTHATHYVLESTSIVRLMTDCAKIYNASSVGSLDCINSANSIYQAFSEGREVSRAQFSHFIGRYRNRADRICDDFLTEQRAINMGVDNAASLIGRIGIIGSTLFADREAAGIAGAVAIMAGALSSEGPSSISSYNQNYASLSSENIRLRQDPIWTAITTRRDTPARSAVAATPRLPADLISTSDTLTQLENYFHACRMPGA